MKLNEFLNIRNHTHKQSERNEQRQIKKLYLAYSQFVQTQSEQILLPKELVESRHPMPNKVTELPLFPISR